jgi:hypothetical protein
MQLYEIECLLENLWMKNKDSWEQSRLLAYVTAQSQSTKKIDMQQMLSFPWEKEPVHEDTQEERDEIMREMKAMEEMMNKK